MSHQRQGFHFLWTATLLMLAGSADVCAQVKAPLTASFAVGTTSVFEGEAFDLVLRIQSTDVRLEQDFDILNLPSEDELHRMTGFQELPTERKQVEHQIQEVRRFRCRARALRAGTLKLAPVLRVGVLKRSQTSDGPSWIRTARDVQVRPLSIEIRPLPREDRPPDFSGAVGQFEFDASVTPTNIAVGDLITVRTRVRGSGCLESVSPPRIAASEHFKIYDPREVTPPGAPERVFEQMLIPQSTNAAAVPAVAFSYFDPQHSNGVYRMIVREAVPLAYCSREKPFVTPYRPSGSLEGVIEAELKPLVGLPESMATMDTTARKAFDDRYFDAAAEAYQNIIFHGHTGPAVQYNLGTTYLLGQRHGLAVLHLQRACRLSPLDTQIRAGLERARQQVPAGRSPQQDMWVQMLRPRERVDVCLALGVITLVLFLLAFFGHRKKPRHLALFCLLVLALLLYVAGVSLIALERERTEGVVLVTTPARIAPWRTAFPVFTLSEGTVVSVTGRHGSWVAVDRRGDRGWVRADSTATVAAALTDPAL